MKKKYIFALLILTLVLILGVIGFRNYKRKNDLEKLRLKRLQSTVNVTIPEGYNIEEIASKLESLNIINKKEFLHSVDIYKAPSYIKKDNKRKHQLEGFLFPDTYKFMKGEKGEDIIKTMLNRFEEVRKEIEDKNKIKIENKDIDKIMTMASVVEKEARVDSERGKVASVFYNRLNKNIKLESCATVIYALGYHKDKLLYKDLKVDSLYNTYLQKGMPVGPISNPGRKSIEAAVKPDKTNYLYFVSKNDGTHFFTNDYNEFLKMKKKTQDI
ncbi:endolytic transglycosylase MltG [Clostridium oceanicum]|uniref:Endolytic murein transglycosylase n=1 Tax=Clostridium oceanicum TaxID=1543 RepID=A0ABN1JBP9_9CLOT